ncbi:transglycosylase domain-containing protein [Staphylococcus americanisciuri]|uniref:Transglycosylase domain-containing protein n=1 Tax=Staphylococcus americanisciuri TaxID=2973940 RepID=A0ABT2EYJ5_9STAP|nr:transglycosylase domain-containing protein [Staphylococcus americanisciuri]MCS4485328.1 transglycosylase domain-containing protein [Staphylococcus americanisciuri]
MTDSNQLNRFLIRYDAFCRRIKHVFFICVTILILAALLFSAIVIGYFSSIVAESRTLDNRTLIQKVTKLPEMPTITSADTDIIALYNAPEPPLIAGPAEVSPYITSALIAAEDDQFYLHNGILPKAVIRAIYQDIFQHQFATGGSTITQQLIKNQILSNERTYSRKAKEIMYAIRIEKLMTKDEIIFTYLNRVSFGLDTNGHHITGITSAAYGIFGKPPSELNLAESAYITGLLQSPYYYTPFDEAGNIRPKQELMPSIRRQQYILKRMLIEGMITRQEYEHALSYDIIKHFST